MKKTKMTMKMKSLKSDVLGFLLVWVLVERWVLGWVFAVPV